MPTERELNPVISLKFYKDKSQLVFASPSLSKMQYGTRVIHYLIKRFIKTLMLSFQFVNGSIMRISLISHFTIPGL